MTEYYLPASHFLRAIFYEEIGLEGSKQARHNLKVLIEHMYDEDESNRDWAALFLSQYVESTRELYDVSAVRAAFLHVCSLDDLDAREEALVGLSHVDREAAIPLVLAEFKEDETSDTLIEAAEICADTRFLPYLRSYEEWVTNELTLTITKNAIRACEEGPESHIEQQYRGSTSLDD